MRHGVGLLIVHRNNACQTFRLAFENVKVIPCGVHLRRKWAIYFCARRFVDKFDVFISFYQIHHCNGSI